MTDKEIGEAIAIITLSALVVLAMAAAGSTLIWIIIHVWRMM